MEERPLTAAFGTARGDALARRARASPWLAAAMLASVLSLGATLALADDELPDRVGRVASVQGPLYHAPDESPGEWSEIGLNYPVAQGDNLWVEREGHAEVDYGGGQFRLAGDTSIHVSRLDERQLALFIASGGLILRVRVLEPDDSVRVDTPTTQVALRRPGLYRIDVVPDLDQTTLIVREGEADLASASGPQQVLPGQTAVLTGTAAADIFNGGGIDGFDAWSATRDRVYERPRENAYVSRQMVGQADLDAYGNWQTYPDYGAVWFPTVAVDWAPYRFGHWTWLPGWGYAWVDDAPWGYAPFHYGRWVYVTGRWGWCPGAFVARPLWAPALVAWYGGAGWSYSAAFGAPVYGWVPLGWREPFVPWWRGCSSRCWSRYNRPYAVNAAEHRRGPVAHFANWSVPGGVTAVPSATLTFGKPVAINRVPVGTSAAFAPSLVAAQPAVKPAPALPGAVRPGNGVPQPASSVYATRTPVAPALPASRAAPVAPPQGAVAGPQVPNAGSVGQPVRAPVATAAPVPRPAVPAPIRVAPPPAGTPATPAPTRAAPPPVPVAPVMPERALRVPPAVTPAPARGVVPQPAPQGGVPAVPPPRGAPAPVAAPQRPTPAPPPAPAERNQGRVAPPNPTQADR